MSVLYPSICIYGLGLVVNGNEYMVFCRVFTGILSIDVFPPKDVIIWLLFGKDNYPNEFG